MIWWTGEAWDKALHAWTFQRQWLGIMQSEQDEYQFRRHLFEFLLDSQPFPVANICFLEPNGGWDLGGNEPFDWGDLHETGVAVSCGRHGWFVQPKPRDDAFEIGLNKCSSFLCKAWSRKNQTLVNEAFVDTAGHAKTMVCGGPHLNHGESCWPQHKGIVKREKRVSYETPWLGEWDVWEWRWDPVPREEKTTGQADREHDHGNKLAWLWWRSYTSWMSATTSAAEAAEGDCQTTRMRLNVAMVVILFLILVMLRMFFMSSWLRKWRRFSNLPHNSVTNSSGNALLTSRWRSSSLWGVGWWPTWWSRRRRRRRRRRRSDEPRWRSFRSSRWNFDFQQIWISWKCRRGCWSFETSTPSTSKRRTEFCCKWRRSWSTWRWRRWRTWWCRRWRRWIFCGGRITWTKVSTLHPIFHGRSQWSWWMVWNPLWFRNSWWSWRRWGYDAVKVTRGFWWWRTSSYSKSNAETFGKKWGKEGCNGQSNEDDGGRTFEWSRTVNFRRAPIDWNHVRQQLFPQ